ncbi:hypothetical protein TWF696_008472 [Orbilia brochopaga]|uniref:DUF7907 domain-containing protein n=1 Tax=Orbilia brochopaga TaxID=3140254 RepID=A0AAV9UJY0_9PEZI
MRFIALATAALAALTASVAGINDLAQFKVKSKVIEGNTKFCGLWGSLYHTGAGMWDVTFQDNRTAGWYSFINNTQFQWAYPTPTNTESDDIPWALDLQYQAYNAWGTIEVSAGYGSEYYGRNFTVAENGTIVSDFEEWAGWLICDWGHQVPQLFWAQIAYNITVLCSCARVELYADTGSPSS